MTCNNSYFEKDYDDPKWDHGTLQETLAEGRERIEREMISLALQHTDRNVTRAAALLAISRRGIQMKIKQWGL